MYLNISGSFLGRRGGNGILNMACVDVGSKADLRRLDNDGARSLMLIFKGLPRHRALVSHSSRPPLAIQSSGKYPMFIFTSTEAAVRQDVGLDSP